MGRVSALRAFAGVGKSFIMHITRLDIIALGDLPVHSSSSTILFIKLLHSSLGASVRIIIQETDLIPPWALTKKQPPSVREILGTTSVLLLHLIYVTVYLFCARNSFYVTAFGSLDSLMRSTRLPPVSCLRCPSQRYAIHPSLSLLHIPVSFANGCRQWQRCQLSS